jgi:FAD/FMN-containing dehydrogenase
LQEQAVIATASQGRPPENREGVFVTDQDDLHRRAMAWVERTCAEQGVPVKVSNPESLDQIAKILAEGRKKRQNSPRA